MPKVTLGRFWSPGVEMHAPGDVVEVDEATAKWLEETGALDVDVVKPAGVKPVVETPEPEAPAEPEPEPKTAGGERPARAASIDAWREYAEKQGIATKGLSKQEIIAATR